MSASTDRRLSGGHEPSPNGRPRRRRADVALFVEVERVNVRHLVVRAESIARVRGDSPRTRGEDVATLAAPLSVVSSPTDARARPVGGGSLFLDARHGARPPAPIRARGGACGEVKFVGPQWTDLNLEAGQLAARRSRVPVAGKVTESTPKSGSARAVALDPGTVVVLRAHRLCQLEERLAWGEA